MRSTIRRTPLLLALLATLALAAPADAATAVDSKRKRAPTCKRKGSKTVRQNRSARVFQRAGGQGVRLYGCLKRRGRSIRLSEAFDDEYTTSSTFQNVRLAGRFVAWEDVSYDVSCKAACPPGYNPNSTSISVYDLARRRERTFPGTVLNEALVLTRRGSIAWAQRAATDMAVEVYVAEGTAARQVDRGNVDPDSLRLSGGNVVWTKDGAQRSSPIR